jgi:hypothetical protein
MADASSYSRASDSIAVLFHPSTVPVIDVFRSLGSLEDQYDLALLDEPERALTAYTDSGAAKAIVSDALLLAFALTRQRGRPFEHKPLKSRHGSLEEYCLLALIGASRLPSSELALEAAAALEVTSLDFMAALAGELVRQIDQGGVVFPIPSLSEFKAIIGTKDLQLETIIEARSEPGLTFKF